MDNAYIGKQKDKTFKERTMINKLNKTLDFYHNALNVSAARHELLSSNIANADTPNFKARDINFMQTLQNAMTVNPGNMTATSTMHMNGDRGFRSIASSELLYRVPQQPSIDGNTVDMDTERMQFINNSIKYDAGLTFINNQFRFVLSAIREGNA